MTSQKDFALYLLGRVHSSATFLTRQNLMRESDVMKACVLFHKRHPEIGMSFEEAMEAALKKREAAHQRQGGKSS